MARGLRSSYVPPRAHERRRGHVGGSCQETRPSARRQLATAERSRPGSRSSCSPASDGSGSDDGESTEAVKRVGLMHVGTDTFLPSLDGMKNRLAELGWVEGKNMKLIWRNLEPELADAQARAFVLDKVDVIVAFEDKSIEAAQKATSGTRGTASRSCSSIPPIPSATGSSRPSAARREPDRGLRRA